MTETVIHQNPAAVASPVHTPWEVDTRSVVTETLSTSLERKRTSNGGFSGNVSVSLFQNEQRRMLFSQSVSSSTTYADKTNPFETSDNGKEEFASSSDDYLSDKAEVMFSGDSAPTQGTSPGIRWKALNNSDEETSDGSDEVDGNTDDEGSNDKAGGMSDMETKNLLEDAVDDEEESDLEDSKTLISDIGRASKMLQGHIDINDAVCGANEHVVEFFKRSGLDREKLSKIWSLSDVNEDGYLDLNEFSAAMHLIVLHIKGHIPIPDVIPLEICPPVMPRRDVFHTTANSGCNGQGSKGRAANVMQDWKQFDYDEAVAGAVTGHCPQQYHSFSDEHLHVQPANQDYPERLSTFSDVPPLLVDVRPTALRATQPLICANATKPECPLNLPLNDAANFALSPQAPKGPPPKPPPRPASKGHGRSASLDLNNFSSFAVAAPGLKVSLGAEMLQRGATLPAQGSLRYHPCNSMPSDTARFSTAAEWQDASCSPRHPPAPPLPPRATFVDVCVQTENNALLRSFNEGRELIELDIDMEKRIEELLAEESNANTGGGSVTSVGSTSCTATSTGQVNWQVRCGHLRLLNSHLEAERAKLAQIRLQLELRLQEATGNYPSMKPTSL
uniref:EF-hand domain-containing protein n=1 Tax=Setaria digitata TaxID=48799 RepID=A0A915PUK9_9BILA